MEPPVFPPSGLATVRAAPGSDATLILPVPTGTPPFNYQWSRAGASLDERFAATDDAGGVRLTVSAARTGDTNVYTLQASNAAGSDTSRLNLEVCADEAPTGEDPPTFLRRLQDLTVKVGTRTRFLVEIVSSTECKVTWFRNERRLLEAERVALARDGNFWCADVAAVSVDDAGRWTCTAENAGGRASCSAHLNVLVPKAYKRPEFVEELRALLTEQGTVSLECKVVGVPTPVLRWFKDSREIKAGDVFALTANAEDPTSLGTYTCEAVNCMGRAYSSSKVHVVGRGSREGSARPSSSSMTPEPPPIFTKELEDQFVRICEPLTLGCHIVVPPWPRSVVWYNKDGKVEPSERYHVLEDGAGGYLLEVGSAEWPDEGEWKCVATSSGGRIGISTCYITMDVPKNYRKPRFMENLQAVLTEEGLVSFECKVVGFPTPVLSWFKDGQELKPGDVYQLTGTNSLGSYCCIARNCMGQASSSAELTVEDIQNQLNEEEKLQLFSKNQAPKFIQGLKSVEAKIDEPFRFTVKVAIPPEPSVLWYRDDQPVDESSRCHLGREERGVCFLDIESLEFLDQAEWKCVAMNDFGHSVTSCFLKLIIPRHYKKPRFLENLQAILSDEGAVNLECKVIGVPQPVLKWYKDGEELKPGDIHRIISGQDGTCCLGTYTCEAQNCMGIAASSASLLGFDDSMKAKKKKAEEQALQRNLSLSTIHEERTSQMYDTPVGDVTTLDDKGEISFSFDGKEVSVSLYETPDLTEEEALQIVEMYADQLSENITEHNVVELPPLRFVKETSTSGNLLMEAVIIDVSPEYFVSPDEDMRTEADLEDLSIADENGPPQLSLDQDFEIAGEDYLEKTMALLSDERSDVRLGRKKSDSQRSADDFFSLSRDQSLSEEKRDDDTQVISDMQSFASAHSSGKPKSKSSKPSGEDGQESSEPTKTILFKDEALKHLDIEPAPIVKPKKERRTSRSSRRSSSGSEKSVSKSREELLRKKDSFEMEMPQKLKMTDEEFKTKMVNISTSLSKVINDIQIIERDIILKSELMSSAATASRSLEIISSLISPLSEIHSIADAAKEAASESKEASSTLFNSLPQPLKALQQSLTIIEKCIDMESDSKTLVKKTCVAFVETCGSEMQKLISDINSITSKEYLLTGDRVLTEIESLNNEMSSVIKFSADTIKARNLLSEASEIKVEEPTVEVKHLRDTQKAVFELKSPLISLLCIAESADSGKIIDVAKVRNSEVILNDMSASIQDLQTALEQIETLSVMEATTPLNKYNTEIIETVMESVVKLRTSFEQLSTEPEGEDEAVLKQAVTSIKENLYKISTQIEVIEKNIGTFDVLQSENKLDALQKMAQILIALENNLPRLEPMPEIKNHMTVFHKNLTKVLENVIESNESKKYFALMEVCDAVNRINASIKNLDVDNVLSLASLNNTLRIIQDQFIANVFDSELNCSLLTNISDTLVNIQEAINTAEEVSIHVDSEHIQPMAPHEYAETKAKVVMEHIDHAIAAIEHLKAIESTQEFKTSIAPTLECICPVLEELKRSVASFKASGVDEEHISDISEVSSFAQTFATPLCELNQNIIVLNQQIVENIESLKQNSEVLSTIAEPIHELHTTLEILQQDVISQYGEDLTPYDVSVNMASAVQNLQSCILMIQEQAGVEGADDMSTLEDISGIKTTADTIPFDRLVLPATEETAVEQAILPFNQELQTTATAQALQTLHEHITVLQNPEIIEALDTLSEVSDYSSLKSFVIGLGELHSGIEEVLHPLLIEGSNEIGNLINPSKLTAIAEPMQELQQSLSVLDTSNIPIYENLLEMPTERIHSVIQSVSEFKEHLDKCMLAVFPAMHTADNTVEIANKVGALREVCEHLKDIIETTKAAENIPVPEEVKTLEHTVDSLLDATDVSKGIKIELVKMITEKLYEKVATVQEEMIHFTSRTPAKLAQEAKLIQTIDEVQNNIAVLEQYDFVDLSRASDLTCTSPQIAVEMEADSLMLMEDIVDSAVNVVQDSTKDMPVADLMIVEDFFKTCKNEFTILRCLISKATTHKKIIRLLQEFSSLQSTINDFKTKRSELNLTDDINGCLATFLIHADDCLQNVQTSLVKIVDSQAELLIEAPLAKFENSAKVLKAAKEISHDEQVFETVDKFVKILEIAQPSMQHVQADILEEIKTSKPNVVEDSILANMIEEFATFVEEVKTQEVNIQTKEMLDKVSTVIEKHDFKDASGTGKTLILLKCLSDCTDVLQESLLEVKIPKQKLEEGPLKAVLTEMLEPLQALHSQLANVQEQVLSGVDEESISVDITATESLVLTMTEKHKEMMERMETEEAIANEEISLIMEVDKEIQSIQDSLRSIENVQVAQVVKEIAKPVEDIEKSMQGILSSEKANIYSEDKLPKEKAKQIIQHIDQYIELIEIVEEISAIIKIDDIKETMEIAKELRESIAASETIAQGEESLERVKEVRKEQNRLALKLHTALSALQVQVFDSVQELAPALSTEVIQRIARVTAQLQADLVAVTGIRVALQAPVEPFTEGLKKMEAVESQATIITPKLVTAAVGSESTILDQIGVIDQVPSSDQLIATTEMLEKSIAEIKEIVTVEDAKLITSETIIELGKTEMLEALALEGTEAVLLEQTETAYTETIPKEHVEFSVVEGDQAQEVASVETLKLESESAVVIEDLGPVLHEVAADEQHVDVGISQKAELQEAPKATIENLVLHIDQFISKDITEVINELANIIDADELKQSISIAKEMRKLENIASSEVELKAETSDVLKDEMKEQYAQLAEQLSTALVVLETLSLDTLADNPSINKESLQQLATITENLRADLVAVKTAPKLFDQLKDVKLKKVASDTAQLKPSETKVAEVTLSAEQIDVKAEAASIMPTVPEDIESVAAEVQQVEEAAELQDIKYEAEAKDLVSTTQTLVELTEVEAVEVEVGEASAVTAETEPIIIEEVTVSEAKAVTTEQAIQKSKGPLQKATTETLLQNINEFLSDNIVQTIDRISSIMNVDELKQSVAVACDLRESIETTTDKTTTAISAANGELLQKLQNAIATVHTVALESTSKLKQGLGEEAIAQLAHLSSNLSLELAGVMLQVHVQQGTPEEKLTDENILKQVENASEYVEQISSQREIIVEEFLPKNITEETMDLPATETVEDVVTADETKMLDQGATKAFSEQINEDTKQIVFKAGDEKSFQDQSVNEPVVVIEQTLTESIDATAVNGTESLKPSQENIIENVAETIVTTDTTTAKDTAAVALTDQTVLLEEDKNTEKLIISKVATACDLIVESSLLEPGVATKPIRDTGATTRVTPTEQLAEDVLTSYAIVKEQQVQSALDSIGQVVDQNINADSDELSVIGDTVTEIFKKITPYEQAQLEKVSIDDVTVDNLSVDVVTEEGTLLQPVAVASAESNGEIIPDGDIAVTRITALEDIVQPLDQAVIPTITAIHDLANEIVDPAILIAEEAIQPLVLEKEEVLDSNIPSPASNLTTDVTNVEIAVQESLKTFSLIVEEQSHDVLPLLTDTACVDVKVTEDSYLDSMAQQIVSVDKIAISTPETDTSRDTTTPLDQKKSEDIHSDKSNGEIIKTEAEITPEETEKIKPAEAITVEQPVSGSIELIDATEEVDLGNQEITVNGAVITEQPVNIDKETTACIDLKETKPLNQEETATELVNIDKSFEQEPKVIKTETQFDTEIPDLTPVSGVEELQTLEQETSVSDAVKTEQYVAIDEETITSIDLEERKPFIQDETFIEHTNLNKSFEQKPKVSETETQLVIASAVISTATNVVEQDLAGSDAIQTQQHVAVSKETTSSIDIEKTGTFTQKERSTVLEPKVTETESPLGTKIVKITTTADIVEPKPVDVKTTLSVETVIPESAEPATEIKTSAIKSPEKEKVDIDTDIFATENTQTSAVSAEEEVKQPEQVKLLSEDSQKPQGDIIDITSEKIEESKISEPAKQAEVSPDTQTSEQERLVSKVARPQEENVDITPENSRDSKVVEPITEDKPTEVIEDLQMIEPSSVVVETTTETVSKLAPEDCACQPTETAKNTLEQGGIIQHIDEFISDEITQLVGVISELTNSQELNASIEMAKDLRASIEFLDVAEEPVLLGEGKVEQAKLAQKLQDALSNLHTKALESAKEIAPMAKPDALQRVSEIITHLQEDLDKAVVSGVPLVLKTAEIVEISETEENSMKQLEVLLKEVTDKINLPTVREIEDNEALRDALDEVQTVIIKLKRDYDGATNDTLNETLEDLECSVRIVQLQINEDSPPELLQEACATLQLLVNNMSETQEVKVAETLPVEVKNEIILEKCSTETNETVKLLEQAAKVNIREGNLAGIVSSLTNLKDTIKTLKLNFADSADVLIEKGVEVVQILDQLEDKVFTLEKDLAQVTLTTEVRDQILTAVHSVYGSIANMRGTISSIQKIYMFENYGKPSKTLLRSIKNVSGIIEINEADKQNWKSFKKSLRKVLNHFEDIKFYINLDKTARLPSDAAFTKIILEELKSSICEIMVPEASVLGLAAIQKVDNLLECVNKYLTNIELKSTLEVKEKIPVFKEISAQIFDVTDFIKTKICELLKENELRVVEQESEILQQEETVSSTSPKDDSLDTTLGTEDVTKEKLETIAKVDDIDKVELKKAEEIAESPSTSRTQDEGKKRKVRKQVMIQETGIRTEIEKVASELIEEITAQAISTVQNLEELGILSSEAILPEAMAQSIEVEELKEVEVSEAIEGVVDKIIPVPDAEQTLVEIDEKAKLDEAKDYRPSEDEQVASVSSKVEENLDSKTHVKELDLPKLEEAKEQKVSEITGIDDFKTIQSITEKEAKESKPQVDTLEVLEDMSQQDEKEKKEQIQVKDCLEKEPSKPNEVEEKQTKGAPSGGASSGAPSTSKKQDPEGTSDKEQEDAENEQTAEVDQPYEVIEKLDEEIQPVKELPTEEVSKTKEKEQLVESQENLQDVHEVEFIEKAKQEIQVEETVEKQQKEEKHLQDNVVVLQKDNGESLEEVWREKEKLEREKEDASKLEEKLQNETGEKESERKSQDDSAEIIDQAIKLKGEDICLEPKKDYKKKEESTGPEEKLEQRKETEDRLKAETGGTEEAKHKKPNKKTKEEDAEKQQKEEEVKEAKPKGPLEQKDDTKLKLDVQQNLDEKLSATETQADEKAKKDTKIADTKQEEAQQQVLAETKQSKAKILQQEFLEERQALEQAELDKKKDVIDDRTEVESDSKQKKDTENCELLQTEAEQLEKERIETKKLKQQQIETEIKRLEDEEQAKKVLKQTEKKKNSKKKKDEEKMQLEAEEKQKVEAKNIEKERLEAEKIEQERLEAERLKKERLEAEELEEERIESENIERERIEAEKQDNEQVEAENKRQKDEDRAKTEDEQAEKKKLKKREDEENDKLEAEKQEKQRVEAEKLERERIEAKKLEKERVEAEKKEKDRVQAEKLEKERADIEKIEKERIESENLEKERIEAENLEKERIEAENLEKERVQAEKIQQERVETEKKEEERVNAERLEKERSEAEKLEKERLEEQKLDDKEIKEKEEGAKKKIAKKKKKDEENAKLEAEGKEREQSEKLEKQRTETEKLENERVEAEKLEKERVQAEKLENERAEAENLEKELIEAEKREIERLEAQKIEEQKIKEKEEGETKKLAKKKKKNEEIATLEAERKQKVEAEKLEKERIDAEKLEKKRVEAEKLEKERVEAEKLEKERVETEKLEKQRGEAENLERERVKAEKLEKEGIEAEKLEKERIEAEKQAKERVEAERMEKERVETERKEKERVEAEKLEKERIEAEKLEKERIEAEKLEKERVEAKKKEKERVEAEKKEKERVEAERMEKERVETEKLENERVEAEKLEKERIQTEKLEKERTEAEKLEKERIEAEKLEKARNLKEQKIKELEEGEKKKLAKKKKKDEELAKLEAERKQKEEADKLETERVEAEKLERERFEAEKKEKQTVEAEKLEKEQAEVEKLEKRRIEAEKLEKERLEEQKLEEQNIKEKKEGEKKEKKKDEEIAKLLAEGKQREQAEKLEKERIEAEKLEKERVEAENIEKERVEAEKLEKDEVKNLKFAIEKKKDEESENLKAERKQKEEAEKLEKNRIEIEERDRKDKEKQEASLSRKKLEVDEKKQKEQTEKKRPSKKKKKDEEEKLKKEQQDSEKKRSEEKMQQEKHETDKIKRDSAKKNKQEEEKAKWEVKLAEDTKSEMAELETKSLIEKQELEKREKEQEMEKKASDEKLTHEELTTKRKDEADKLKKAESEKRKEEEEKAKKEADIKKAEESEQKKEKAKLEQDIKARKEMAESEKLEKERIEAERLKSKEEIKLKEQEKEKIESEKKREEDEKFKQEQAEKVVKEKEDAEKKRKYDENLNEKKDADEKYEFLKQEEDKKREMEKKKIERLQKEQQEEKLREEEEKARLEKKKIERLQKEQQDEKLREEEEKARLEKKIISKKKREEEDLRMKAEAEEAEKARKDAAKKRKEEEKLRQVKEQEQYEKRQEEIRGIERRTREERRREIEKDLIETTKKTSSSSEDTFSELKPKRKQNGDVSATRGTDGEDHYLREYHYEPSRQRSEERTKFVDHNHRDYTMEFTRPSGYRQKTFEHERFTERESWGRNATIYKAQTIVLDSQLRSSAPPQPDRSESERRTDRYDRSDSERRLERHRSKALSEARSMISEKRSGLSRDLRRKPVFSTHLTDRTAVEGSRVKLTCSVLSSFDPKVTWYKNGVLLEDKLKYRTKFMDGLITLEVLNAVVSDSAEYSCTVENENGSVNSSANLKVYPSFEASPIPPTFTRSIRDTYHLAEDELVLECRIRGQPLPTITWLKDDKPVSHDERFQAYYLADGVCRLAISSPTPEDSGNYTCKAENSVWTDQISHIVSFTAISKRGKPRTTRPPYRPYRAEARRPHFTNVLSDYKVTQGGTIGLQVEIMGSPTRVEWLREGRSVTEVYRNATTFVEKSLYTLALSDVTEKESGVYTCRAWTSTGNVDMNAAITVVTNELEGKPAIIAGRPEQDILISVGEDINISFRVQGDPKPKVVFMKGIRDISNNQRCCKMTSDDYVRFTMKRAGVADAGTYCILARNAYGCDRAFVTVVVRQRVSSEDLISDWIYPKNDPVSITERKLRSVPDRIPGEPSVVEGGNNWVSLAWPKPETQNAPVQAYKVESWQVGKEGGARWVELGVTPLNAFDAFNLKQGEEYHFRIRPKNRYGWGEAVQTSTPVGIGIAGDRPEFRDILPGQLKVLVGETANLSCSVKGKPVPEIVWMKNGHEIEEESRMTTLYNGQDCSLTIKDVCIEDEARYSCEASNVHGRASTYARVAVVTDRLIWEADAKLKRERSQDAAGDYPPQFTMRLRDRRVQATFPVRLTCQVVGNPPPALTWFKDGETLVFDSRRNICQDEHFHTLEIAPTTLEDGGVYEAMARNSSGAVSCRCSLVVDKGIRAYVAPEFCCGLEPLYTVTEGEELRISAVVEAYPSVGVTWYRDGVRLRPSRRAIMTLDRDGQIELALAFVTYRDAGVYTCTASNEVGKATTSGKVTVAGSDMQMDIRAPVIINTPDEPYSKEPMFVRKPRSSEAREGDTVIIACEVIGDPKPDVYWLRDFLKPDYYRDASHFKRVGEGPEYRFEIPHAKLDYTGAYSVVARNLHGEAKAIISLQIKAKDPSSTDDSHNVRYGTVEVIPRFDRELTDLLSYDGDAIEFECHVTGNPEPDIRWFHYNELIHDCPDFESTFDEGAARLKIKQVTAEDEGTYSCEASNNLGKTKSSACLVVYPPGEPNTLSQRLRRPPALLSGASTPRSTPRSTPARSVSRTPGPDTRRLCSPSRQMAPSFYTYPYNKVVEEGDSVTLKCAVKGQPTPWATWDKDGIVITPSARFTTREKDELLRILEIEQVTIEDVGVYRITIENEFGRAEASARLEVITQKGKFYAGVRAYSASPRKALTFRRFPSLPRQD